MKKIIESIVDIYPFPKYTRPTFTNQFYHIRKGQITLMLFKLIQSIGIKMKMLYQNHYFLQRNHRFLLVLNR